MNRSFPEKSAARWLSSAALVLWVLFIWGNSLNNADVSGATSGSITELLRSFLPWLTEFMVRKGAHFAEYTVLGLLLALFLFFALEGKRRSLPLVLLLGMTTALLDETIQLFVPGRAGAVQDVLLDCSGVLFGLVLGCLFRLCLTEWRRRQLGRQHEGTGNGADIPAP